MEYRVIYSGRKTVGISVRDGEIIVRAPRGMLTEQIEAILAKHEKWIKKTLISSKVKRDRYDLSADEISQLKSEALPYFADLVEKYSALMSVCPSRISITSAKKRFGSCSSKGNICFSLYLMLYPESAREYVVVHELAHLIRMDHSREFYRIVSSVMPDYIQRKRLLVL